LCLSFFRNTDTTGSGSQNHCRCDSKDAPQTSQIMPQNLLPETGVLLQDLYRLGERMGAARRDRHFV
jgi:hypothetical protein